jgi:hypothetical protein
MRRRAPWLVAGIGLALAVGGISVFWTTNLAPGGGAGWAAYAPLQPGEPAPDVTSDGWTVSWTAGHLLGAALLVLGLLVLAGVAGWSLGRRSARR